MSKLSLKDAVTRADNALDCGARRLSVTKAVRVAFDDGYALAVAELGGADILAARAEIVELTARLVAASNMASAIVDTANGTARK